MKRIKGLSASLIVSVVSLLAASQLGAQATERQREELSHVDSSRVLSITTNDGSTFVGRVVAVNPESVDLRTSSGRVTISFASMKPRVSIGKPGREDWFENPNQTRLFFAPTGQMLKKGEGYFSDYELFFPGVAYGVTDNFSIGGGVSIFPTDFEDQIFYVTPKLGVSLSPKLHVAVGAILSTVPGENSNVGAVYGVGTVGDGDASLTSGIAYGFAGSDFTSEFALLIGGEKRLTKRIGLVSENYIVPSSVGTPVVSAGLRFMSEKLTVDLGLFNAPSDPIFPGLPWVGFVYKF
ncbi:MAG TPA: hypothetical protein VM053_06195 [Gemmatimonadaceae bacterium]|nr:hypothetical protein [Gemmatimonadaceae bacterium]